MRGIGGPREMMKYPLLWPIYALCFADMCWLGFSVVRTATRNPDVVWDHNNNPEPWNDHRDKRYRLWAGTYDYSKRPCLAPIFKNGDVIPVQQPEE